MLVWQHRTFWAVPKPSTGSSNMMHERFDWRMFEDQLGGAAGLLRDPGPLFESQLILEGYQSSIRQSCCSPCIKTATALAFVGMTSAPRSSFSLWRG
jgi:hypothetical protein